MMRKRPADAATPVLSGAHTRARAALVTLAAFSSLALLALLAYALAAARVPQQRAALEQLVQAETGLDVSFSELDLRWGWYGPEAVFHNVGLREPGVTAQLLSAPELIAGIDPWGMLRSGQPSIGRLTLINPDIDLSRPPPARPVAGVRTAAQPDPLRLLTGWRGTRILIVGGTLRASSAAYPLAVGIRRVELRRSGSDWRADAALTLPENLGTVVQVVASLHAAAADAADLAGTVTLSGSGLDFAGWHTLLAGTAGAAYLPAAGGGAVSVQLELARGALAHTHGSVDATQLSWPAAMAPGADFALERLQADWTVTQSSDGWRLAVRALAPLKLRVAGFALGASLRETSLEWNGARSPAERLHAHAELRDLRITAPGGTHTLAGLSARLAADGGRLSAELHAANARLTLPADPAFDSGALALHAQLVFEDDGRTWRLSTRELEIHAADALLALSATLSGDDGGAHPRIEAHAQLTGAQVGLLRRLIGAPALATFGGLAGAVTAGSIGRAELVARGPLDQPLPWNGAQQDFHGSLELTAATLAGADDWPQVNGLDAHVEWQRSRLTARVAGAAAQGLLLSAARGEWDTRDRALMRLSGRLEGPAEQALAWLRDHPQRASDVAALGDLGLSGGTLVDFDIRRVAAARAARAPRYATRLTALLDGARLHPVAGLPGIEALRGTLAFADGHLQRSTVTGQWLGGPLALRVSERREHDTAVLALSGRGLIKVQEAVAAAGGMGGEEGALEGNAEWSADLRFSPVGNGAHSSWRLRADSNLIGVASQLPAPFAKSAGVALPVHLELEGGDAAGELRVALGERLRGVAALRRRGDLWQIERGAVGLGGGTPALPAVAQMRVEGNIERLDLADYVALWRGLARSPAWPALSVELAAAELRTGAQSFAHVRVLAATGAGVDQLRLESEDLDALVRFPTLVDAAHPVTVRLERLDLTQLAGSGVAPMMAAALGPAVALSISDLEWQGRALGALTANFATRDERLEVRDLLVHGGGDEARGTLDCSASLCRASFRLESGAAAATLARLGFRADLDAAHAAASGELSWPAAAGPSLAGASGRIHIELTDGVTQSAARLGSRDPALGLLAVPGLVAAMGLPELRFARLDADFNLGAGQATTSNLHLDGETEILMQGRVGLLAQDYDARVWVLKGEERLPAAVRGFSPGARVAAIWMSLRDFFGGADRERAALRLRGTWDDPMVTQP
jgi:uncharacterized protein YhdP